MNEEVKIKWDIIQHLKKTTPDKDIIIEEVNENNISNNEQYNVTNETESNESLKQKLICKECDYETLIPEYIKSPTLVAHRGQYVCQRDCKNRFKILSELDDHIEKQHIPAHLISDDCDICDSKFTARYQLRLHVENKHKKTETFSCGFCGEIFTNMEQNTRDKMYLNAEMEPHVATSLVACAASSTQESESRNQKKSLQNQKLINKEDAGVDTWRNVRKV